MSSYLEKALKNIDNNPSNIDKQLIDYFQEHSDNLVSKTLSSISKETNISETSIFKFVTKMGFDGFKDFKIKIAQYSKTAPRPTLPDFSHISPDDKIDVLAQKVIKSNIELLTHLYDTLDIQQLSKAISLMRDCKFLHFFGQGASSAIALDAYHKFQRTHYHCSYVSDYHMQLAHASKLSNDSCAILFSHSGNTKETVNISKVLNKNNIPCIVMTGNPHGELINFSDAYFITESQESKFQSEALAARILYLTMSDILYVAIMSQDEELNFHYLHQIREAIAITSE